MKHLIENPRQSALTAFLLALPVGVLLPIAAFEIEPLHTLLKDFFSHADGRQKVIGVVVIIASMLALPIALALSVWSLARSVRAGFGLIADPANLILALVILGLIAATWGVLAVDQGRCVVSAHNCD